MPSEDTFHAENPQTNRWLEESGDSQPSRKTSTGSSRASASGRAPSPTKQAAHLQKLAATLGVDAEELAKRVPEDTLRRLKYPMLEQVDPETGLSQFKHDRGIMRDRPQPLVATDRAHTEIPKGSKGYGAGMSPRGADGRYSK